MTATDELLRMLDELRERAATLRQGRWSDGADDARLMEDAADTIWELRDDLQRANAENAKLREVVKSMYYDLTNMTFPPDWVTDYAADMRELGIEVGDGVS